MEDKFHVQIKTLSRQPKENASNFSDGKKKEVNQQ
jgi:hypothetical protein